MRYLNERLRDLETLHSDRHSDMGTNVMYQVRIVRLNEQMISSPGNIPITEDLRGK